VPVGLLAWAAFPLLLFVFVILLFAAFIAGVWIMPAVVFGFRTLNWADGLHFVSALVWFDWLLSVLATGPPRRILGRHACIPYADCFGLVRTTRCYARSATNSVLADEFTWSVDGNGRVAT
jgi:hypothetical protein